MSNFVDYVKIHCKSGHGGAGSAHLRRENISQKVVLMVVMVVEVVT
jgi:GTP-binding protein